MSDILHLHLVLENNVNLRDECVSELVMCIEGMLTKKRYGDMWYSSFFLCGWG